MIDADLVCPSCRRFWHGPAGELPFPSPRGVLCANEGHALARRPDRVTVVPRKRNLRVDWLDDSHLREARDHAVNVHEYAQREKLKHARKWRPNLEDDLETRKASFIAEVAVAVFTGLPWRPIVGLEESPDVGDDIDVKWRSRPNWDLIVEPELALAHPDWRFVLARGRFPDLFVSGWAYGHEILALPLDTFGNGRPPIHRGESPILRFMDTL